MDQSRVILAHLNRLATQSPDGDFFSELALQHTTPSISSIHKGLREKRKEEFNRVSELVDLAVSDPDKFVHIAKHDLEIPLANKIAVLACQRRPELWALFSKNRLLRKAEARDAFLWLFKSEPFIDDKIKQQHVSFALRSGIMDQNELISIGLISNEE
jgi:hypothetical protein